MTAIPPHRAQIRTFVCRCARQALKTTTAARPARVLRAMRVSLQLEVCSQSPAARHVFQEGQTMIKILRHHVLSAWPVCMPKVATLVSASAVLVAALPQLLAVQAQARVTNVNQGSSVRSRRHRVRFVSLGRRMRTLMRLQRALNAQPALTQDVARQNATNAWQDRWTVMAALQLPALCAMQASTGKQEASDR